MMRTIALAGLGAVLAAGCVSDDHRVIRTESTATHAGLFPSVVRPRGTGAPLEHGQAAIGGAAFTGIVETSSDARVALGNQGVGGFVGIGVGRSELQLSGDVRPGRRARVNGTRGVLTLGEFDGASAGAGSVGVRTRVYEAGDLRLFASVETGLVWYAARRSVSASETMTTTSSEGTVDVSSRSWTETSSHERFAAAASTGASARWQLDPHVSVGFGLNVGLQPYLKETATGSQTCEAPPGQYFTCEGDGPDGVDFVGVGVSFVPQVDVAFAVARHLDVVASLSSAVGPVGWAVEPLSGEFVLRLRL